MPRPTRNYFYEIDPAGYLYHDGTQLVDRAFLDFFFRRLRANSGGEAREYPWVSPCGPEMNFVRAAGAPIVFDRLVADGPQDMLGFNHTSLRVVFEPERLRVSPEGALLHPARPEAGIPCGRLHGNPLMELSANITEDQGNYILTYGGRRFPILPGSEDGRSRAP
ncbi:MAG: DUF4505 family protein [Leptospirales bacterium]|jgi:hypothetical protein